MAKKPAFLFRQSGVIPIYQGKVVLITSRRSGKWTIPKGGVERGMSQEDSALKEAVEEGGLIGWIEGSELGIYTYKKWGGICTVTVYLMRVETMLAEWNEKHLRERDQFTLDDCAAVMQREGLSELIAGVAL